MLKKIAFLMFLLLAAGSISGCWDYRDINKVYFPSIGAYDLCELPGQPRPYVKLINVITDISPEAPSRYRIETTIGPTVGNARRQKAYYAPGEYSPGVSAVVVLGEDLVRGDDCVPMDALFRTTIIPESVDMAVAEGKAEDILRLPIRDYNNIGDYLKVFLRGAGRRAYIPSCTLHNYMVNNAPGKNPVMPLLTIKNHQVKIAGAAIFRKEFMIGKADVDETRALMMLRGMKSRGVLFYKIKQDDKTLDKGSVEVDNRRQVKVVRSGDDFTFIITIDLNGTLVDHQSDKLFTKNEELGKMIEKQIASDVASQCTAFVKKMQQEYRVDCIDVSKYALAQSRKELSPIIDKEEFIQNAVIQVNVNMKLRNIGELT